MGKKKFFVAAEARWEPPYAVSEFVPQEPEVFGRVATRFASSSTEAGHAVQLLRTVTPERWKGAARTVYEDYLGTLVGYFSGVQQSTATAAEDVRKCGTQVEELLAAAGPVVAGLNDLQTEWAELCDGSGDDKDDDGGLFDQLGDMVRLQARFNERYADAVALTADAELLLDQLHDKLDAEDAALAALEAPAPPGVWWRTLTGGLPPELLPLFSALFGPVDDALDAAGATAAAAQSLQDARDALDGDDGDRRDFLASLDELDPDELAYVLNHLDEDDVAALLGSIDPAEDRDIYNQLAAVLPPELLERLADTDPNHYWHPFVGPYGPVLWDGSDAAPLGGDPDNLHQGGLGDCHVLASLAAVEAANPGWLEDHVRRNANGTYTVTLYDDDGDPIEVVVTPELPYGQDSEGNPTDPTYADGGDAPSLYSIYEKALAQTWGELDPNDDGRHGYEGMNGGWAENDLPHITGQDAERHDPDDVSADELREALEDGRPLVVSSLPGDEADGHDLYDDSTDRYLVAGHAYYVTDVSEDGMVTISNPWGNDNAGNGTITLTWDEFQDATNGISVGG